MATSIFGPKNLRALAKRKLEEQRQKMMERRQGGALKQEASPESPRRKAREEAKSSQAQANRPSRRAGSVNPKGRETTASNIRQRPSGRDMARRTQRATDRPAPRPVAARPARTTERTP